MKKIIMFLVLAITVSAAFGQYINKTEETSFRFIAPDGATVKTTSVLFPTTKVTTYAFSTNDTLTMAVKNYVEYLNVATLGGSFWLNLTINSKITPGAMIVMKFTCDGTNRKVYYKTGFATDSTTVTASTKKKLIAIYDGTSYNVIQ